ncbi:Lrp/AsnC family transcriptional regulator [Alicyclobacillus mengziensis]|uniref:Lrp/AsnC family transcriptional regulator n=1 Tax=Alicyclobacillus mengziensis TaxID=2931921 RepID=A0A9X7W2V7_9BACL|nr:Lrp/AsnC family transcriptional regulator [Alicyclobacillus mengziensis]QSO49305.1 Lrp/AsnC family transcriptional regulator [Alicyclobacillus mengziensis]
MAQNGRIPFVEIAEIANVSEATIRNRYQRLTSSGILTVVGVVDPFRTGIYSVALVAIQADETALSEVCSKLSQYPKVRFVVACAGTFNIMAEVIAYSTEELTTFIAETLPTIPGIRQMSVNQELKLYKNAFNYLKGADL